MKDIEYYRHREGTIQTLSKYIRKGFSDEDFNNAFVYIQLCKELNISNLKTKTIIANSLYGIRSVFLADSTYNKEITARFLKVQLNLITDVLCDRWRDANDTIIMDRDKISILS